MDEPKPNLPAAPVKAENIRERTVLALSIFAGEGGGKYLVPSMREKFIVEEYLKCFNYTAVARAYEARFGKKIGYLAISKWMKRGGAAGYLKLRMGEAGVFNRYKGDDGKALWLREMLEYREGIKRVDRFTLKIMDMIGQAMGYMDAPRVPDANSIFNMENVQINFTDRNGEA